MDPNLITAASTIIAEPIKSIIDTWLKPKLEEFIKRRKLDKALFSDITNLFSEYLNRTYDQQKIVNILALELQQVQLEQVYIPLRIFSKEKGEEITVNEFDLEFIKKYKKIVIEDTAGMGKSTLMKKLFISSIKQNVNIPIFIELRNLSTDKDIIDEITESINSINRQFDKDIIRELIARGDFTFFLDGFDEIAFSHKEKVIADLLKFIAKADNNFFFLTSRFDESLSSFGQFQKFNIDNLEPEEAYNMLIKYDSITKLKIASEAIKQIDDNIKAEAFEELESFLGNPLLVSLLYLTFKYKRDIPSSKLDFYRKVYDAFYESHDLTKGSFKRFKYCGLSSEELKKVLERLSFLCLKENVNFYSKDKILKLIEEAKGPYFKDIKEEYVLKDLLETVPFITCAGLDYKWAHKSFIEYFSALFIDRQEKKEVILGNIYKSDNFSVYLNMLDFYYEVDRPIFDRVFVYPIIKNYIDFIKSYITQKTNNGVEYYQRIYNKAFYFTNSKRIINEDTEYSTYNKKHMLINKEISGTFPNIINYSLIAIHRTMNDVRYLFVKDYKFESVLKLLYTRKNSLVTDIVYENTFEASEEETLFFAFEEEANLDLYEFNKRIALVNTFGELIGRKVLPYLYIDYYKALEYLKLVRTELSLREKDIFSNL